MDNISDMNITDLFEEAKNLKALEHMNKVVCSGVDDAMTVLGKCVMESNNIPNMSAFMTVKLYVETMQMTINTTLSTYKKKLDERENEIIREGE